MGIEIRASMFIIMSSFGFVPGVAMIFGAIMMKRNNRKRYSEALDKKEKLECKLLDYYYNYPDFPIGFEYCAPDILIKVIKVIESGRANVITDAINIFHQEVKDKKQKEYMKAAVQADKNNTKKM